jgi:recombination protein RecT
MTTLATSPEAAATAPPNGVKALKSLLQGDQFTAALKLALPRHLTPDRFIRVALTALLNKPLLGDCDQASFFKCLLSLSQMGLEPDGRQAHLIPFKNNKKGTVECQLIIDYKGFVALALRSGKVSKIHADVVCENDIFDYEIGEITRHSIDFRKPRGQVYAAYALCRQKDGTSRCEVMSRDDVEAIRRRSKSGNSGPWVTDWNEMAKKTVFRRMSKWLEFSNEYRDALLTDDDPRLSADVLDVPALTYAEPPLTGSKSDRVADVLNAPAPVAVAASETSVDPQPGLGGPTENLDGGNVPLDQPAPVVESEDDYVGRWMDRLNELQSVEQVHDLTLAIPPSLSPDAQEQLLAAIGVRTVQIRNRPPAEPAEPVRQQELIPDAH